MIPEENPSQGPHPFEGSTRSHRRTYTDTPVGMCAEIQPNLTVMHISTSTQRAYSEFSHKHNIALTMLGAIQHLGVLSEVLNRSVRSRISVTKKTTIAVVYHETINY